MQQVAGQRARQSILALLRNRLQTRQASGPGRLRNIHSSSAQKSIAFFSQPLRSRSKPSTMSGQSIFRSAFYSQHSYFQPPPRSSVPAWCWTFIALNTGVFGAWQYAQATRDGRLQKQLFENFTLSEYNLRAGRYWTLITSAFSQKDLAHFVFNMITLNAFCSISLAAVPGMGSLSFLGLALGSGLAGSIAWLRHRGVAIMPTKPKQSSIWGRFGNGAQRVTSVDVALGASGLVSGVGAAATLLRPFARVIVWFVPAPLWLATCGMAAVDAFFLNSGSRIGHSAHLGGAGFGAAFYFLVLRNKGGVWPLFRRMVLRR